MITPFRLIAEIPRFAHFAQSETAQKKNRSDILSQGRFKNSTMGEMIKIPSARKEYFSLKILMPAGIRNRKIEKIGMKFRVSLFCQNHRCTYPVLRVGA